MVSLILSHDEPEFSMICTLSSWLSLIENSSSLPNPRFSRYFFIKSNSHKTTNPGIFKPKPGLGYHTYVTGDNRGKI